MKSGLRIFALLLALGAVLAWFALGAHRGWTRTSIAVKTIDEVTGIEGIQYQDKFVPGVELLGGVVLGAALIGVSSFFVRKG